MRYRGLAFGAALLGVTLVACGLDTSGSMADNTGVIGGNEPTDGSTPAQGTDGGVVPDGGFGGDAANDSPSSPDSAPTDSAPPAADSCAPSPEKQCTDGIDNDCNGLTDCADPACSTKTTCEPPVANGWAIVAFDATGSGACPAGYGTPTDVVSLTGTPQPRACGCSCSVGTPPSCVVGTNITLYANGQLQCPAAAMTLPNNDGACVDFPTPVPSNPGSGARVTPLPPSGGACKATASNPPPPPPPTKNGRVCTLQASSGGGCTSGGACVPVVGGGYAICLQQTGDVACPAGYPNKTLVGNGTQDGRTCSGSCTCGAPTATCGNAQLTIYANAGCTGHSVALKADDQCNPIIDNPNNNYSSHKYTAEALSPSCGAPIAQPTPTGTVTLQNPHTVCCP